MNRKLTLSLLLTTLLLLLLTGCELSRAGQQDITTAPAVVEPVASPTAPLPGAEPPTAAPPAVEPTTAAAADIEPESRPAQPPPPADIVEPGKVLVKLTEQAAIQARSVEMADPDQIVSAGIPTLDERLAQIGASGLEPVISDVAGATGKSEDQISIQVEQVGQLYFVAYDAEIEPQQVADYLNQDPAIEFAEPNFFAGIAGEPRAAPPQFQPNDPYYKFQWHLQNIQMPAAWDMSTGQNIIVAIIDTGIDFNAPDLANTPRVAGYDFANNDPDPTDDQGHGTHVAGTVAQSTNNGLGVAGLAFNARLMPVKALGSDGNGSYENIIKGIVFAVDQGADVINMSLAGGSPSASLQDAVRYAHSKGVVVVAAAGNNNGPVSYPAAYDDYVIAVAATRFDNSRSGYSNYGPQIDIAAPGGDVKVDQNGDGYADGVLQQTLKSGGGYSYQFWEGTSMASPHVAGLAALLLSRRPDASPAQIEAVMAQTALRGTGTLEQVGAGVIQAAAALNAFAPVPVTPTFTPIPPTATFTPFPPTLTPTFTPVPPVCTPPPCPGGVIICPGGNCPGGCGVVCATATPLPPTVTPTFTPVPPTATFTPSPSPTATPFPPTATFTPIPPPSATFTPFPPTATFTPIPPPVTATPTPSPTPALPVGELLLNGGFETNEGWIFGQTPVRGEYDTRVVRSGSRSALLGIFNGYDRYSYTSMWQPVTIPAEARQVTLTVHTFPISYDWGRTDSQNILILNDRFRTIRRLATGLSNSQVWEPRSFDLSDLRGQTVYVYIGVYNNGWGNRPSAMFVDDVSLQWTR
ncbi:MAG: hypothetical protein Kow0031_11730 [Anaerolineae bacterium]